MTLCHELLHVRRGDLWLGWVPALAQRLFYFHPLVRLAAREYALAREAACDAEVLRVLDPAPDAYGRLLLRLGVAPRVPRLAAAGAAPSVETLKRRLMMLQQASDRKRVHPAWWGLVALIALVALIPFQMVAQDPEEEVAPVAAVEPVPEIAPVPEGAPVPVVEPAPEALPAVAGVPGAAAPVPAVAGMPGVASVPGVPSLPVLAAAVPGAYPAPHAKGAAVPPAPPRPPAPPTPPRAPRARHASWTDDGDDSYVVRLDGNHHIMSGSSSEAQKGRQAPGRLRDLVRARRQGVRHPRCGDRPAGRGALQAPDGARREAGRPG